MRSDELPFRHPWDQGPLATYADVIVGGTPSTDIAAFWGGDIKWMASGDIHQRHIFDVPGRISERGLSASNAVVVSPKAVAMALAGQGKTRGAVALTHVSICTNQSVALIKPKDGRLDAEYLYQSLIPRYEEMRSRSAGGGRAGLTKGILEHTPIQVPPPREQRAIADILSTVDVAIDQTEALIAKTQQIKAGLMHDLFTRGVTPDGQLRPPREESPKLYKESPLGWIPAVWKERRLNELADVERGKFTIRPRNDPRYYNGQYPFIQTGDVALASGRVLTTYSQTLNEHGLGVSRLFPVGTIMVTIAANIADTCILGTPMCAPDSLVGVIPNGSVVTRYLELCIRRRKRWFENRAPQTAQRNINLEDLRPLHVPCPEPWEQALIADRYEAVDALLLENEETAAKLRAVKRGLMHDLLTGRVRVPIAEAPKVAASV